MLLEDEGSEEVRDTAVEHSRTTFAKRQEQGAAEPTVDKKGPKKPATITKTETAMIDS